VRFLLVGLALVLVVAVIWRERRLTARRAAAAEALQAELAGSDIRRLAPATCVGHDVPALGAMRGPGALAVTGTQLRFTRGTDGRSLTIPLGQLVESSTARSFGTGPITRPRRRPLLVVHWVTGAGALHRVAWDVDEAVTWASTLAQLIGR
jgi:hypothetical protein